MSSLSLFGAFSLVLSVYANNDFFTHVIPICPDDQYFLYYSVSCPGPECDSRFMGAPCINEAISKCGCPSTYPYYVSTTNNETACITEMDCPGIGQTLTTLPSNIFNYPTRDTNSQCPYTYTLCTNDTDCSTGTCNVPNHPTIQCIHLYCHYTDDCKILDTNCLSDCMGAGYGYCDFDTQTPTTAAPTTSAPTTSEPTTSGPTTSQPTSTAPTTTAPTTTAQTTTSQGVAGDTCTGCIYVGCSCNLCSDNTTKYGCCDGCILNNNLECIAAPKTTQSICPNPGQPGDVCTDCYALGCPCALCPDLKTNFGCCGGCILNDMLQCVNEASISESVCHQNSNITTTSSKGEAGDVCDDCVVALCPCVTCQDGMNQYGCCGGCILNDKLECVPEAITDKSMCDVYKSENTPNNYQFSIVVIFILLLT